jgi:hypothetical protein
MRQQREEIDILPKLTLLVICLSLSDYYSDGVVKSMVTHMDLDGDGRVSWEVKLKLVVLRELLFD